MLPPITENQIEKKREDEMVIQEPMFQRGLGFRGLGFGVWGLRVNRNVCGAAIM